MRLSISYSPLELGPSLLVQYTLWLLHIRGIYIHRYNIVAFNFSSPDLEPDGTKKRVLLMPGRAKQGGDLDPNWVKQDGEEECSCQGDSTTCLPHLNGVLYRYTPRQSSCHSPWTWATLLPLLIPGRTLTS